MAVIGILSISHPFVPNLDKPRNAQVKRKNHQKFNQNSQTQNNVRRRRAIQKDNMETV